MNVCSVEMNLRASKAGQTSANVLQWDSLDLLTGANFQFSCKRHKKQNMDYDAEVAEPHEKIKEHEVVKLEIRRF
jgi:hypothetical protein